MAIKGERLFTMRDAARRMGITSEQLQRLVKDGTIEVNILPDGRFAISMAETKKITREQFESLRGQSITILEASKKHGINQRTWERWSGNGWVKVLRPGRRGPGGAALLDLADVEYCAAVYRAQGGKRGMRLFNEDGSPYTYLWPKVKEYRARKRDQASVMS